MDRVEMILPQVHLRNGELLKLRLGLHLCICGLTLQGHVPFLTALKGGISSHLILTCGSAFAGVGLNIKQEIVALL